ncbi:MAG TPA: hypothetical protein VD794_00605, partial [Flavisolibacter sp.]|nr:hypothetical protein [Flavisolibacter sp.]
MTYINRDFESLVEELTQWADKQFGEDRTPLAAIYHLKKEVDEVIEAMATNPNNHKQIETELA